MENLRSWGLSWRYGVAQRLGKLAMAATIAFSFAFSANAQEMAIAALGDSLTQGYGLIEQEGFVPQLTDWLATQGEEVLVINAGVSGDTTAGGLSRVDWTMDARVKAMIVALGGNDVLRGIDPQVARANLDGILQAAAGRDIPVLLVGIIAPGNFGPDYKAQFEAIYPELASQHGTLLYPNFLDALIEGQTAPVALMQPDGIHPNGDGVKLIVQDMGPSVLELINRAR